MKVNVGRHIPKRWNTFILPTGDNRRSALCGVNTTSKHMGIPGMTPQVNVIVGKNGARPGWCPVCIKRMLTWYSEEYKSIPIVQSVQNVYDEVFWEMFLFIKQWNAQPDTVNIEK